MSSPAPCFDARNECGVQGVWPWAEGHQFERIGYFCTDPDSTAETPVFNRTVGLRDTWAKIQKAQKKK